MGIEKEPSSKSFVWETEDKFEVEKDYWDEVDVWLLDFILFLMKISTPIDLLSGEQKTKGISWGAERQHVLMCARNWSSFCK